MQPHHTRHYGAIALSTLWDDDRKRAKAQIVSVRDRVNVHDAFARARIEPYKELVGHTVDHEAHHLAGKEQSREIDAALEQPLSLLGGNDPQRRAKNATTAPNELICERCRFDPRPPVLRCTESIVPFSIGERVQDRRRLGRHPSLWARVGISNLGVRR